ncbi:hypothetical protein [Streptomyces marianii]|uniref:Uncharacterized protein n=1 Tax=Streptomyces marianii TaxID=1817406 RepID=A0A5R9EA00_9ACTN|nr:hypothetical protein [Streptomyces marianii]TLQ44823.1 hypothetical protein FEF34_18590 [Streptomyces marianii]
MNGFGKDPLYEHLESGGTRRIRGIAAQAFLLAFQLAHANKRKLATWAGSIVLHGEPTPPSAHPPPQHQTLGHPDPKGYLTKATA